MRRLVQGLLVAFGVLWCGSYLVLETARQRRQVLAPPAEPMSPGRWPLDSAPVRRLRHFLAVANAQLPAGEPVAFASPQGPGDGDFFLYLWAAYLLPERHLLRGHGPWVLERAGHLLAYRVKVDSTRLEEVRELPGGTLYRVVPEIHGKNRREGTGR